MPKLPNPTTPNPLPLILHMCSPCTHPFPKPHHPSSPHPLSLLLPSPSRPHNICSLALSTLPRTPMHNSTSTIPVTGRRRSHPHPSLRLRPVRDRRAAVTVTGVFPVGPPPARAVQTRTCTAWASAAAVESQWRRHKIRAAVLVLLALGMALDVLGLAGRRIRMDHRRGCTRVSYHPVCG